MSKQGTTKEQLASLCTDMSWLKEQLSNHLKHHEKLLWVIITTMVSTISTLGVIIINFLKDTV